MPLYTQLTSSYGAAFSQGTLHNRIRQAKAYLAFMLYYMFDYLNPTPLYLMLYIQFLANTHKNITSVKNYLSGAKTFISDAGGSTQAFYSPLLQNLYKGITRLSNHIPAPAPTLSVETIKAMCDVLAAMPGDAQTIRSAILMGFSSFVR